MMHLPCDKDNPRRLMSESTPPGSHLVAIPTDSKIVGRRLTDRLRTAIDERYRLPAWDAPDYMLHKRADHLAAASEAFHVTGWSREEIRGSLEITLEPLDEDPLPAPDGIHSWEP